ncbi:hypothetical protein [Rurimicrobium arvi]|uniref:Outer membrane protein beta-barrel domain-containing protein n=1 Tax=Rurimicrobium arvi TaxID=2049916 RepID=A0ABP8MP08_9BACT
MKKLLLNIGIACCAFTAKAQFFIGGGAALNSYRNVGLYPALQPRLGLDYKEGKISIIAGFNFSPFKQSNRFGVYYSDSSGKESTTIAYTEKITIHNAFVHGCYRLGNMENAFRPKLIMGASSDLININYSTTKTVPKGLKTTEDLQGGPLNGPKVDIGIGFDYRSNEKEDLNVELILGLPANQVNGQYVYNPTVTHFGLNITYSHYFGKREYAGW